MEGGPGACAASLARHTSGVSYACRSPLSQLGKVNIRCSWTGSTPVIHTAVVLLTRVGRRGQGCATGALAEPSSTTPSVSAWRRFPDDLPNGISP